MAIKNVLIVVNDFILIIVGMFERNTPSVMLYQVNTADLNFVAKSVRAESARTDGAADFLKSV
jgi:hypothetical protein